MRAWLLPGLTGIGSLRLAEAPEPVARPGEIILALKFAALNPADRYLAEGQYPARPIFPHILGRDGAGTVVAIGDGVTGISPGDARLILRTEVGVTRPGTLAQRVAVPAAYTASVPPGWPLEQAAAAPLVYVTAWQALTQWGFEESPRQPVDETTRGRSGLPADAVILVTGASGGVGVATVQLARAMGYTVIALSRSPEKQKQLRDLGAALTFDPQDRQWRKTLKEQLGKKRVDLAVDNIGGTLLNEVLETMAMWGKLSVVGRLAGPVPEFNSGSLFFRRLRIGGVAISTYTQAESHDAWTKLLAVLAKTSARPLIDRVFPFDEVPAAFARLHAGPMGKVLVKIE